ncbi:double-strand break repair protein AddB [Sphingomonas sabuli]|uniref:Double-strand break repair protein AddB n=1 Tax=Sphingomonas sabuli TaxID=2764186 RepID=A0A7G9L3C1_9SPHN|nr:double-strand break repair protein AddB [Sphingomonas sabuli]QNM83120.1 double-strand break repair protein AddB [Sphingomonas sabuli]
MPDRAADSLRHPAVYTIPTHRSFADSLVAGLIARFGRDPLLLAGGRILLPNNRAVRTVTDAFVRASGSGLVLPRLIPVGDAELEERIGGALDPADMADPVPPAVEPLQRLLALADLVRAGDESAVEALRLSADLSRTLDALLVEQVDPSRLAGVAQDSEELASHWQVSLDRLRAILILWPEKLRDWNRIDLADRRNRLLERLADRWATDPPVGFTVAAGITTTAPAIATLLKRIATLPDGMVVLPGLARATSVPDEEWDALGPDDSGRGEETHPQFHLKLLLDRIGVARDEVRLWPRVGSAASTPLRARAVANAFVSAQFSDKWIGLKPAERRLSGIRTAVLPDTAAEAQAIALAIRETLETPGKTAALVTPDRMLARRVSALLARWSIHADDSAGTPLSERPPGTLLLSLAAAMAEELAPVSLLALLKHPLVGGEEDARRTWLDDVRLLDVALRGPRPAAGLHGLDRHFAEREAEDRNCRGCVDAWHRVRSRLEPLDGQGAPTTLAAFVARLVTAAGVLAGDRGWRGQDGRMLAELLAELEASAEAQRLPVGPEDAVAVLAELLAGRSVRPPYGDHPRVFIWGLLEARLQQADLMILAGLNEGVWPAVPAPDPWLAPRIRGKLGLPGLDFRIGLSAHDFASALGAREVLITRSKRDGRSPTVASRFLLRLEAISGGLPRDYRLERLTAALDDPGEPVPVRRPQPRPPAADRPKRISVTAVDRLKADPFAFYAQAMLRLRALDPVDADHTARWKGSAVHKVFEDWLKQDECDPDRLRPRAEALLADETIHPMLRALWAPRLLEAIDWMADLERSNRASGRAPLVAEAKGEAAIAGITVHGIADRIDRLAGTSLAIIDYKTGRPPAKKAIDAGFALQLGLLGLIARAGGFDGVTGDPQAFEYWSLVRDRDQFGKCVHADKDMGPEEFLAHAFANFAEAAEKWLNGTEPFTAKLNPAFAPYGDYDQLMRLEEWYGRND